MNKKLAMIKEELTVKCETVSEMMLALLLVGVLVSAFSVQSFISEAQTNINAFASVLLYPSKRFAVVGDFFTVNVSIINVTDLYAWQVVVYYRNDVLEANGTYEGPFLMAGGDTYWVTAPPPYGIWNNYNATHGRVYVGCTLLGPVKGVNGSGITATIRFKAKSGNSTLTLEREETIVLDSALNKMSFQAEDGYVVLKEMLTDLNNDGKVDMRDIGKVARLFGVNYPDPSYDPNCDITGLESGVPDGKIDMRDVSLVARDFGKTSK